MTASEELKEKAATLPEPLAKEVLDFLLFVSGRKSQPSVKQPPPYTSLKGAWQGRLSSSDAFAKAKAEEKELEL